MVLGLAGVLLASNLVLAAVNHVPDFNINPSCSAIDAADVSRGRTADVCKMEEQEARGQLEKTWTQFSRADRSHCVQVSTIGGSPSYVELLTCLEITRDARTSPEHSSDLLRGEG